MSSSETLRAPGAVNRPIRSRERGNGDSGWLASVAWILGIAVTFFSGDLLPMGFRDKWMAPLLIAVVVILGRARLLGVMQRFVNPGMVLVLLWALFSAAWSPRPMFVATQAMSLIGVSLIALGFSLSGWHPDRFARQLAATVSVLLVLSIITAVLFPHIGVHSGTDISLLHSWRGVTFQKNGLGQLSVIGLIVWTYLWAARKVGGIAALLGITLCVFTLMKSRSSASLALALPACLGTLMILRPKIGFGVMARRVFIGLIAILVPLCIYAAVATSYFAFFGELFGKDGTFSGRTLIWNALITEISTRPWLGTGLNSFWGGVDAGEIRVQAVAQWDVRNGHNGYIDVVNELGLIGLALFLLFLIYHSMALARLSRISRSHYALHLPLFIYVILANTSESGWFFPVAPTHLIGMYASLEVSRLLLAGAFGRQAQARATPAPAAPPLAISGRQPLR